MARSKLAGLALICSLAAGCGDKEITKKITKEITKEIITDGNLQNEDPIKMKFSDDKASQTWSRYLYVTSSPP